MTKYNKTNNKSFAMVLVVFLIATLSIFGLIVLNLSLRKTRAYTDQRNYMQAVYLAEAAKNLFLEYDLSFENDFSDNSTYSKDFGTNYRLLVYYFSTSARSADMEFWGGVLSDNYWRRITLTVTEDEDQNDAILRNLKKYNAFIDHPGATSPIKILNRCTDFRCYWGHVICGWDETYDLAHQFHANTYFNQNVKLKAYDNPHADDGCTNPRFINDPKTVWGSSENPKNIYINGTLDLSDIASPWTSYGVFGDAFYTGEIIYDNPVHGTKYKCPDSGDPGCNNWPAKPPIDKTYYETLLTKAGSGSSYTLTIDCSWPYLQLNNRDIYVKGVVNINNQGCPLQGPGNIIATLGIGVAQNAEIDERIRLISGYKVNINSAVKAGGTLNGNDFIVGDGVIIYVAGDDDIFNTDFLLGSGDRLKAFILVPRSPPNTNRASGYITRNYYSQVQGLIYTEMCYHDLGRIYGNVYTDYVDPFGYGDPEWEQPTLGLLELYDDIPGIGSTESQLPIKIRGLYGNVTITNMVYQ